MRLLEDGGPADPAVWEEWQEILSHKSMLTENEAFDAMLRFVSYYRNHNEHDEIPRVLEIIRSDSPTLQETWRMCVRDVMAD
jgi:hypothetical protein